jgi:hypothetical protein
LARIVAILLVIVIPRRFGPQENAIGTMSNPGTGVAAGIR